MNAKTSKRSGSTRPARSGPALLGQEPQGNGLPIASREGAEAVAHARRDKSGRTLGQPECAQAWRLFRQDAGAGALHEGDCTAGVR